MSNLDERVRLASFDFLRSCVEAHGEFLGRSVLAHGFEFERQRVPLVGPQGIFKPRILQAGIPLSITTTPTGPYKDRFEEEGVLLYSYRGTNPMHHENVGLRRAIQTRTPLIYFCCILPGRYVPAFPVYVEGDDVDRLHFRVRVDADLLESSDAPEEIRRSYATVVTQRRVHQQSFRERVIAAYGQRCSICSLKHPELLEAAHIIADSDPRGLPEVPNGISLCRLHHAAFDRRLLGIRPDRVVQIRKALLEEPDGPMLEHGLKRFHDRAITVPRRESQRPRTDYLAERYEQFMRAS